MEFGRRLGLQANEQAVYIQEPIWTQQHGGAAVSGEKSAEKFMTFRQKRGHFCFSFWKKDGCIRVGNYPQRFFMKGTFSGNQRRSLHVNKMPKHRNKALLAETPVLMQTGRSGVGRFTFAAHCSWGIQGTGFIWFAWLYLINKDSSSKEREVLNIFIKLLKPLIRLKGLPLKVL